MSIDHEYASLDGQARERVSRLQVALGRVNRALLRTESKEDLFKRICDIMVHDAGYHMAWIGWLNPKTHTVVPAASSGEFAAEYLKMIRVTSDGGEMGQGPTGAAIREGRVFVCNSFLTDTRTRPWHDAARKTGVRSSAAFPFRCGGRAPCGTLNIYSDDLDAFQATDVALLEEITADLSFRLSNMESEAASERPDAVSGEKKEMFRKFADSAGEVFWIMNVQPELVLYVNPAFEHIWGRPVAELYRNPRLWMDSIHIDDRPRIMEAFSNWIQKVPGSAYDVEYRIVRPDGNIRWIFDRGFALLQEDGPGSSVAGIAADMTERKIAEENLEVSRERYKSILDNMMEGCMIIGFDWTYLYVNDVAARHGYQERQNLIGRTMMSVYPGVEKSAVFTRYRQCMEERAPQRFESSYTFDDGTMNWYEFRVAPVPEGIFVLSLDITERVRGGSAR